MQDITLDGPTYRLQGPWVRIINFEAPATAPSTTTDGNWTAVRGNNAFNDVMTYFHIDQNQRYIRSLGFTAATAIQNVSIEADSDGLSGDDNSHYIPSTNRLAFGHGCVDDNEDADVILHEYGHAITHDIVFRMATDTSTSDVGRYVDDVSIQSSGAWTTIGASDPGATSISWSVPALETADYCVRITGHADGYNDSTTTGGVFSVANDLDLIFQDDFESGDTSAWSSTMPPL